MSADHQAHNVVLTLRALIAADQHETTPHPRHVLDTDPRHAHRSRLTGAWMRWSRCKGCGDRFEFPYAELIRRWCNRCERRLIAPKPSLAEVGMIPVARAYYHGRRGRRPPLP